MSAPRRPAVALLALSTLSWADKYMPDDLNPPPHGGWVWDALGFAWVVFIIIWWFSRRD